MTTTTDDGSMSELKVLYGPFTFEAADELPSDDYEQLLIKLVKDTGEAGPPDWLNAIVRAFQRMVDVAPDIPSKCRAADYLADELRHCYMFDGLLRGLGAEPDENAITSIELLHMMTRNSEWPEYCILNTLGDRAASFQIGDYAKSSYAPLARVCKGVARDERGHATMGAMHLKALCLTEAGRSEAQELLTVWYPAALDMFGRTDSRRQWRFIEYGLKTVPNVQMRERYVADVNSVLEACGLEVPDPTVGRKVL